jgi:hypothetical protein
VEEKNTNVKTVKVSLSQAIDVISNNFVEAKNQRPTSLVHAGEFMLSVIHWTNFESESDDFISNLFSDSNNICTDKPIFIKLAYSPDKDGIEIQDGQFRIKSLMAILSNAISVPTETNVEAYKWITDKFGGMCFEELPKTVQNRFKNASVIITFVETNDASQKSALFHDGNCGNRLSTKDILNNNYHNNNLWIVINNLVSFVKSRTYVESNEFNFSYKQYNILHNNFRNMTNNMMLNFFVRNLLAIKGWKSSSQIKVCEELFELHKNISYEKALTITKRMVRQLIYVQKFFVCEEKGLTLYTAMISFAFGYLNKDGRRVLDEKCEKFSQEVSRWLTIGLNPNEKSSDSILSYMSNAYSDTKRLKRAKDFFISTYSAI